MFKMFKTETHLHVSEISPCGMLKAKKMVELYHEAGYKTIFVSDHLKQKYTDSFGDIPWEDKMTIFMSGYYKAKYAGEQLGINVLPAVEIAFEEALENHYLVYGITKEFLCSCPDIGLLGIGKFSEIAHKNGLFIVQAHPFRDNLSFPTPEYVDAIEVYNSNPRHEDHSERSENIAKENNLPITSGSDAHRTEDVGRSGVITGFEIKTAEDYINAVKSGALQLIRENIEQASQYACSALKDI